MHWRVGLHPCEPFIDEKMPMNASEIDKRRGNTWLREQAEKLGEHRGLSYATCGVGFDLLDDARTFIELIQPAFIALHNPTFTIHLKENVVNNRLSFEARVTYPYEVIAA